MHNYKNSVLKVFVFTVLCIGSLLGGVGDAKAASFGVTIYNVSDYDTDGSELDWNDNGVIETNYDWKIANFTVNTNKIEYAPGEQIVLNGTAYSDLCENLDPTLWMTASIDSDSVTILDENAGYQIGTIYGQANLAAPGTPGEYSIVVHSCHNNTWSEKFDVCIDVLLPITVAGTPVPNPDAKPDISASMDFPANGSVFKVGNAVSFDMTATNVGSIEIADAGEAGLEVDTNSDGARSSESWTDEYDLYTMVGASLGTFAPGESKKYTYQLSGMEVGDHEFRFEVDKNDIISESNGYNNLSSWESIHIIDGTLTVPSSVSDGAKATLSWTVKNIDGLDCEVSGGGETWPVTGNGSAQTKPLTLQTSYRLYCGAVSLDGPKTVSVTGANPPKTESTTSGNPPSVTATRIIVNQGEETTLEWNTNNGDETLCKLTGGVLTENPLLTDGGDVNTGSKNVVVNAQTRYTLTCPNGTDTVLIEIVPKAYET